MIDSFILVSLYIDLKLAKNILKTREMSNFYYYLSNGLFYFIFPNFLVKCNFFNIDVAPEITMKFRM